MFGKTVITLVQTLGNDQIIKNEEQIKDTTVREINTVDASVKDADKDKRNTRTSSNLIFSSQKI